LILTSDETKVVFHVPKNPKFTIAFEPSEVVVKKGKDIQVDVTLTVHMTTEVEFNVGIEFPSKT
jgi:polyisoprenoid-binding protein YceI